MIIKLIVSVIVILLTTYIGVYLSNNLKKREEMLSEIIRFFDFVENEIKYMMMILPNALEISRQKISSDFRDAIGMIVCDMLENDDLTEVDKSIVKNIESIKELAPYDKNIIISTLKNLGRSNVDAQINILENAKNSILAQLEEAKKSKSKNSKVYRTVGVISGLMIVLVLI